MNHHHNHSSRKADDRSSTPRGRSRRTPPRSKSPDRLDGTVPGLFGVANQSVRDSSPSSAASTHISGRAAEDRAGARRDASSRSPHSAEGRSCAIHPSNGQRLGGRPVVGHGDLTDDDAGLAYIPDCNEVASAKTTKSPLLNILDSAAGGACSGRTSPTANGGTNSRWAALAASRPQTPPTAKEERTAPSGSTVGGLPRPQSAGDARALFS